MDMPPSGMVDHSGANLYKPPDDRVYGRLDALAPECRIPKYSYTKLLNRVMKKGSCVGKTPENC